jgi:hypothetical protein
VFAPPPNQPAEWQILLRLLAIATGRGANIDLRALDDELAAADVQRVAGPQAELVLRALGDVAGPERLLDLALRGGPYGDRFGFVPDGLTLARVKAAPGGIDLGPLEPRIPELLRTASGKIELAPPMVIDDCQRAPISIDPCPTSCSWVAGSYARTTAGCTTCRCSRRARSAASRS